MNAVKTRFVLLIVIIWLIKLNTNILAEEIIPLQTIKGTITNFKNGQSIAGATVVVVGTKLGAVSKQNGSYRVENVPVGRYNLKVIALGYEPQILNIVLTSGKESIQNFELNETVVKLEEVTVTGAKGNFTPINESAIVSSNQFTVDDASRYAGSRMDPARMAQNFAGVLGANDTRNDIIIRGGSPTELLWRLDGLDIPNPNHFATQGATGGPVSAINTLLLDNSDFLTGAFPAEYYDKMSGVFDLRTRKGNKDKYEFVGQMGFNGFELGAEGPAEPINGSFIANYRYSFLGLLDAMGIDFGFAGIPNYQDAMFKLDFETTPRHQFSITGLFGTSDIYIKESKQDDVYTGDYDIQNGTDLLALSFNWKYLINDKLYSRMVVGTNYGRYRTSLDSITTDRDNNVLALTRWLDDNSTEGFSTVKYSLYLSPDRNTFITLGAEARYRNFNLDEQRYTPDIDNGNIFKLKNYGNTWQLAGFMNWNFKPSDQLEFNFGLTTQYLKLSEKSTLEPRVSMAWKFLPAQSFTLGVGVHDQSLPLLVYMSEPGNNKLGFMQSVHYIAGYSYQLSDNSMVKLETYYKDITRVPVSADSMDSFSLLNAGANFGQVFFNDQLKSTGTGRTYGAEFTFMKHFSNGYYVTATASYVRQQYKGSDGVTRWGAFDNQYIFNMLAGYEWVVSPKFTMEFSAKYTLAGGAPYTPIDESKSMERNFTYLDDNNAFSLRKPDYSRVDIKIDFRQNFDGFSMISFVSVENLLNTQNVLEYQWDVKNQKVEITNQLGIFPVGGFRIEF